MTEPNSDETRLEIQSDEDWKERVKAEDAKLDSERSSTAETPAPEAEDAADVDPDKLPPADFEMLVQMFSTQAMVAIGLLPDPQTGKNTPRPNLARHFIDLLGILADKTRGNLTGAEDKLLTSSLHYLRMAFVEASRSST